MAGREQWLHVELPPAIAAIGKLCRRLTRCCLSEAMQQAHPLTPLLCPLAMWRSALCTSGAGMPYKYSGKHCFTGWKVCAGSGHCLEVSPADICLSADSVPVVWFKNKILLAE
jgi:hypothetical protein